MLDRSGRTKAVSAASSDDAINAPLKRSTASEEADAAYEELRHAGRRGESILGRVNQRFQEVLHTNRGPARMRDAVVESAGDPHVTADDLAIRRAKTVKSQRMIVPEGVIIGGSLSSGSETEISGRVEGDVNVDGRLYLGKSALVTGNIQATSCKIDGLVEGRVHCADDLELGESGRLNADSQAGKRLIIEGQIFGNVTTGGVVRLTPTSRLHGNIRARAIIVDDGALFNGVCAMRPPAQRGGEG